MGKEGQKRGNLSDLLPGPDGNGKVSASSNGIILKANGFEVNKLLLYYSLHIVIQLNKMMSR